MDHFTLENCVAEFKDCRLGKTGGPLLFRLLPETFSAGENGICSIASAKTMTVVLGLEKLDEGFAALLDRHGRITAIAPELFRQPGPLRLIPEDPAKGSVCTFPRAKLAGNTEYGIFPGSGHRLIMEFTVEPESENLPYMMCEHI